jgi:RES domain-containing protein
VTSIYRISSSRYAVNTGVGAARYGGRWNPVGTEVIYAAQTASLAALEVLVHYSALPRDQVITEIVVPESVAILRLEESALPEGWNQEIPTSATQQIGQKWVREGKCAILSVPSSVFLSSGTLF